MFVDVCVCMCIHTAQAPAATMAFSSCLIVKPSWAATGHPSVLLRSQSALSESTGITPGHSTFNEHLWQKISGHTV